MGPGGRCLLQVAILHLHRRAAVSSNLALCQSYFGPLGEQLVNGSDDSSLYVMVGASLDEGYTFQDL